VVLSEDSEYVSALLTEKKLHLFLFSGISSTEQTHFIKVFSQQSFLSGLFIDLKWKSEDQVTVTEL